MDTSYSDQFDHKQQSEQSDADPIGRRENNGEKIRFLRQLELLPIRQGQHQLGRRILVSRKPLVNGNGGVEGGKDQCKDKIIPVDPIKGEFSKQQVIPEVEKRQSDIGFNEV